MSTQDPAGAVGSFNCPVPLSGTTRVLLGHGGGGRLTQELIESCMLPAFGNPALDARHDSAELQMGAPRLAFTTDSHVVRPLFFPGGDLGRLAVFGTVNDLAMSGAQPAVLSVAFILEEGLDIVMLQRITASMKQACQEAGVAIVTGDTKVVERGRGDGIFVTTAGIGWIHHAQKIVPSSIRVGDLVIMSGDLGRHGMAIMATREGLEFESAIESDCASLAGPVLELIQEGIEIHCLRDMTRGGAAAAVNELAVAAGVTISVEEQRIPIRNDVRAACEILGLDPMQVACEGRFLLVVPAREREKALLVLSRFPVCSGAGVVGEVLEKGRFPAVIKNRFGSLRILEMGSGEQLPRIC